MIKTEKNTAILPFQVPTMAVFLLFLSSFVFFPATTSAQISPLNISLGSSLTPTGNPSSWLSPSELFAFGFYQQSNGYAVGVFLAGNPQKTVVWTANRDSAIFSSNVSLALSRDGKLILQQTQDQDVNIYAGESISFASMLDSGNFVLYNSDRRIIWQTFDRPSNTLLPGQRLSADQELVSSASETDDSKGIFRVKMQSDGNLVQYPVDTPDSFPNAYYASNTAGSGNNVTLELEDDGHLYLINSSVNILKNITNGGNPRERKVYLLKIDVDGIVRLYSFSLNQGNLSILWESTNDKCTPKGLCGFNAYCTKMDNVAECKCLPGFDFVNPGKWSLGCERNFAIESCKSTNVSVTFDMRTLESILWENNPFSEIETKTKEDCEKVCIEDCNCDAAFFKDGKCRKQRLPLRYGRRSPDSNIAFIKVGILASVSSQGLKMSSRVAIATSSAVVSIFLICSVFYYLRRRKHKQKGVGEKYQNLLLLDLNGTNLKDNGGAKTKDNHAEEKNANIGLPIFSFSSIAAATCNFSVANKLGEGGFGPVYKGELLNGELVAVKRLSKRSRQGLEEFKNETELIAELQHRNLVRILGCCVEEDEKILIYEYMPNKSLDFLLFDPKQEVLDWQRRLHIIQGIAQGLLYLHQYSRLRIVHRDLKASNILLDRNMDPKISDFGLARIFGVNELQANTNHIVGTYGYMSPEYVMEGLFSIKSDVFAFGILVLEILSGKKNTGYYGSDHLALLGYAWELWKSNRALELIDPLLQIPSSSQSVRYIILGLLCVQENPNDRPTMSDIVSMLSNEQISLASPKQPAFTTWRNVFNSSSNGGELAVCSTNVVTISAMEAR